jgi:hypothetical protein
MQDTINCDHSSATIGIGAGIGSTAVVVGLLIVFIYILKRYRLDFLDRYSLYGSFNDPVNIYMVNDMQL